jgi:hypothetical protein
VAPFPPRVGQRLAAGDGVIGGGIGSGLPHGDGTAVTLAAAGALGTSDGSAARALSQARIRGRAIPAAAAPMSRLARLVWR